MKVSRLRVLLFVLLGLVLLPFVLLVYVQDDARSLLFAASCLVVPVTTTVLYLRHFRRSRFRFSLTTLLVVMFATSAFLATFSNSFHQSYRRRAWVARVERAGGRVSCSHLGLGFAWIERWLGSGILTSVERMDYHYDNGTNVSLAQVSDFTSLQHLYLRGSPLGDDDLADVRTCDNLISLSLGRNTTDDGLQHLSSLKSLRRVAIHGTQISDRGAAQLFRLSNIEQLGMDAHQISDVSIGELESLTKLKGIYADAKSVDDSELSRLSEYRLINGLDLNASVITDAGLLHLRNLPRLKSLNLAGTSVSDSGIKHLKSLANLRWLGIGGTNITPAGKKELQRSLPNCTIQ